MFKKTMLTIPPAITRPKGPIEGSMAIDAIMGTSKCCSDLADDCELSLNSSWVGTRLLAAFLIMLLKINRH